MGLSLTKPNPLNEKHWKIIAKLLIDEVIQNSGGKVIDKDLNSQASLEFSVSLNDFYIEDEGLFENNHDDFKNSF